MAAKPPRPLIILDLNGTLLARLNHSTDKKNARSHPLYRPPDFSVNGAAIHLRPHLPFFLDTIFANYSVAVWTSAMEKNAIPIVAKIFAPWLDENDFEKHVSQPELLPAVHAAFSPHSFACINNSSNSGNSEDCNVSKRGNCKLEFIWSRGHCTMVKDIPSRDPKGAAIKDLRKIWDAFPQSFNAQNTFIIDDSSAKYRCTPNNGLHIKEYLVSEPSIDFTKDEELKELANALIDILKDWEKTDNIQQSLPLWNDKKL